MSIENARAALKKYFGYEQFRPMQEEIIAHVLSGQDTVVLMPTGGGKSICFQIPAVVMDGVCVVVSPLIALMKDQVEGLRAIGIRAEFINSSLSSTQSYAVETAALNGELDLLYVSPEKLLSADFSRLLSNVKLSLIAVDEAHCISQWGHDFRPEYTQMHHLKEQFPKVPLIALTATADKLTRKDIVTNLRLQQPKVFVASFDRPNLSLNVLPGRNRFKVIQDWIEARPGQSGIIYCLSRKSTEETAKKLKAAGINATFYHAGLGPDLRSKTQERFIRDDVPIVCATIAFGMGIDKSNVRWVIHYNLPKNIESYYQEIGRAGRDGLSSDTLLFYSYGDVIQLQNFIADSGQREILETKLERIEQYANARICRRKVLLSYFGEHLEENCGNCDICKDPPQTIDGTTLTQKALSALLRMKEKVGANMLIDVLRGSSRADIISKGYDQIKTYGAGSEIPRADWQQFVLQMLNQGLLEIAYDEANTLKVTPQGREVLFSGRKVELVRPSIKPKSQQPKAKPQKTKKEQVDDALFERLRKLRKGLADKQGVPPYIVFGDRTLKEMSAEKPTNEIQMRKISGVGDKKWQMYGDRFINEILQFIQDNYKAVSRTIKGSSEITTYEMWRKGKSPAAIAQARNLSETTIYSHLAKLYASGEYEIDINKFVGPSELQTILQAAMETGSGTAKPIFEHLREKVPYFKIHFALAYRQRLLALDGK